MTPKDRRNSAIREAEKALAEMGESVENLRTLIDAYGDATYSAVLLRAMWEAEGEPVYSVGQKGALVAHPSVKEIREAERHVDRLAGSLNLTPEARSRRRVGAPMGSSTADDRRGPARLRRAA